LKGLVLGGPGANQAVKDRKGISCSFSSNLVLAFEQQRLEIGNGTFTLGRDKGTFEGTVRDLKTTPTWNMTLKSDHITPGDILAQLPMFAGLIPGKINLTGPAGFSLATSGDKETFQISTGIDMKPLGITFGKIFAKPANSPFTFSSRMTMKKDITEINALDVNLGAITANGSGEVRKVQDKSNYRIRIQTNPMPLENAQALI